MDDHCAEDRSDRTWIHETNTKKTTTTFFLPGVPVIVESHGIRKGDIFEFRREKDNLVLSLHLFLSVRSQSRSLNLV